MNSLLKLSLFLLLITVSTFSCSEKVLNNTVTNNTQALEDHPDFRKVKAAIEDYVEALYTVEPDRIENSVDTTLRKVGYYYNSEKKEYINNLSMTYAQLYKLAGEWNKGGDRVTDNSPRLIKIFEINDKSASAKLTAVWGIDYFHLAKVDGKWKIMNVLWQSAPR